MKNKLKKWISVLLVLTLLIGPLAIADENEAQPGIVDQTVSDTAIDAAAGSSVDDSDPSANEAFTSAGEGSIQSDEDTLLDGGDVISASDVDPSVGEISEMDLTDLDGNDGDEPSGTDPIGDTQDIPFDQIVEIGDVSIRVTAGAKSFPEGSTLWADRATDEDIIQAVDAALELNGEYAHCLYRIEVRDASDNAILPFEGFDQPIVRIEGLNASNDTRVACYDSVTETAFEVDAAITDGAVEFAFVDLAIYDFIVPQISEDSSVKEQPTTEEPAADEPSDNDQGEDASSKDGQTENSEDQIEDGKAAEQPEGDQAENGEDGSSDKKKTISPEDEQNAEDQPDTEKDDNSDEDEGGWMKTRVDNTDEGAELDVLYEGESAKLMQADSLQAAEYVSLPSILCVGDVYDLRKCLLFAEYSPSEVVSWKSSKPKVIRIKNGMLTALKPGKAKITVKTTDGSKRELSLSVSANSIGGLFTKPSKSDAVALGNAFSIRPKSLKYSGTKLVAEFYLLNGYKKAITAIRGLNLTVIAGNRTNKLASQYFSKVKVKKGKKKGVSTFKVTFSNVLQNNVHLMDYSANNIYFDLDTSSVYGKAGKKTVPFVATVIPNVPAPVTVSGIVLSNNELYLSVGKTTSLTATVLPDNAENKGIIWSSNNPGVATVSGDGLVTAISEGEATITASAADGSGVSASCAVKVANENVKAASIELSQDLTIFVDQTATLTATISPANVSNSQLEYKLSKAGIVEFTQEPTTSGNITTFNIKALSEGSTQLTVRTIDGSDISTFCTIYVIPSTGFSVKHGSDIVLSTNSTSGTTTIDTSANNEDEYALTISSNYNWTVSASDTSWVTLNKISGSSGTTDLVLKFKNIADGNTYSTELSFIVEGTTKNIMVTLNKNNPVTSITLNQTSATLDVGDTLTLTATVEPDNALNKNVTWSSNNTSVAEVNNTGLVTAKSTGIATITAKAVDGSGKKAECKVTVGEALSKLQITNVNCSVDGEIPISKTVLWAVSTEADSDVQYEFVLLRGMKEIAHQDYGAKNFFRYTFSNPGEYTLNISCEDEDGNKASTTSNHTIQAFPLSIRSVSTKSLERILGDEITWQVETNGGHDPLSYSYELSYNGTVIDTVDSSDSSIYTYATNQAGSYVLNATCIDADATIVSLSSDAVTVVGNVATPIIRNKFGSTEADAPEYKNDAINVEWDSVSDASSYTIELSQKTGNSYEEILKTNVSSEVTSYILQKEIFTVINSEMLYKLSLSATGIGESNADVKYFSVAPINTSLSVDSKSAITWDQASAYSSVRSFSVASDLPWSATTDVDWLSCNSMDDVTLVVSIGERTTFNGVRTGHVVVSNGNTSVTITVNQNVRTEAPEFQYPQLSTDPNNPTSFAAGPFPFRYEKNDHDYVVMKTYELQSGKWVVIRTDRGGSYGILGNKSNDTYKDDTQYKYELAGYYSKAFSENEIVSDALITTYYVFMDADKQVMTVNGVEKLTTTITNELDVDVYSTNLWTVSTDVDWITFDDDAPTKATYKNNFTIVAAVNTTGAVRTGHVYFKTDKKTATVTLTQPNTSTDIISPANISKNSNSPTTLTYGTTIRLGSPNLVHTAAILENGTWRNAYNVESYTEDETMKFQLQEADRVDGTVVRWTFSNGTSTSTYYVKVKMPSTTPYVRINPTGGSPYAGVHDLDASSGKTTLSLKLEANAAWTATSNANWLKISSTSGSSTNEKTLTVTIAANTSGAIRFGEIAFANNGVNCTWLRVTQSAGDYLQILKKATKAPYDASVDFKHENGDKGSIDLAISCNSKWSAQSNNSWLTFGSNELSISNSSSKTTSLYTSQNTTSSPRTGSVTFTCGTASTTVYITQERYLGAPIVTAPAWSTSEQSPTLTTYADVTVKWNAVSGASYYEVTNTWEHHSSFDNGKWITIEETGKSAYSAVLPMDWFATGTDSIQYITVNAFDSYGHYTCSESLCFYMTTDAALIDGRTNQKWEKVDDKGDSNSFVITSSANWTAKSNNKWITINKTSGSNGDSLTVSVTKNTGTKRTGSVKVTVNGNTSTLTVVQCAALMDDPLINPNYALSITDATEISAGTAKITMSWTLEEQVLWYEARLYQLDDEHATQWSVIESSNSLKNKSSYTFDAYKFEAGKMYKVCLYRRSSSGNDFFYRYFTVTKPDIIIEVRETEIEVNSRECSYATNVNSGAQWFAISNNDWLMVDKHPVTQAMLDEYECDTSDYSQLLGNSGDLLYISALANTNSQPRTGSVTIRSGGATATIRVTQYQHYELAKIIEPSLSTTSEAPTLLPYMPLTVYWTKGVGGTGKYSVALYESDSQRIGYRRILHDDGITTRTYVIPEYKLSENKFYNLSISTEVVEGDYYAKNYYFKIDSANPLKATLTLSDEAATVGSEFGITVSASGGTGDYRYAYQLLRKGEVIQQTAYDIMSYYTFVTMDDDIYSIRVYVKDSSGTVITVDSDYFAANQPETAVLSGQVIIPEHEYDDGEPYGLEGVTVTLTPKNGAVANTSQNALFAASPKAGSTSISVITDKYGKWVYDGAVAGGEYIIEYVKNHFDFVGNDSVIMVGNGYTSAGYTIATPTEDAKMPSPVVFDTYEDRATINLNKISSDSLTLTWDKPKNAISYIYAVKLLNGAPSGGDNELGTSLSGTAQDRNVTTTSRKIVIDKSKLKPQNWLKVWIASVSSDGLWAQNVIYLFLSDGEAPGEVTFEDYSNNQTIYYDEISTQGLLLKWNAAENAVKYLVSAKILKGEPTNSNNDEAFDVLYSRSEVIDHFDNCPPLTVPFAKSDLQPGKWDKSAVWLKVAVAAVNAEGVERWSILNLFVEQTREGDISFTLGKVVSGVKNHFDGSSKESTATGIARRLFGEYDPAFIAGVLGNVEYEGNVGQFEYSGSVTAGDHGNERISWLRNNYNYSDDNVGYGGKLIFTGFSLNTVKKMSTEMKQYLNSNYPKAYALYGLGFSQWTAFDRNLRLIDYYISEADGSDTITEAQALEAELKMLKFELDGGYHAIYQTWLENYSTLPNAAYYAGVMYCQQFEKPAGTNYQVVGAVMADETDTDRNRGNNAQSIYNAMCLGHDSGSEVGEDIHTTVLVSHISLSEAALTIGIGGNNSSYRQTVTCRPSNATKKSVTWKSNNTSVATVDPTTGIVTGVSAGNATITATATDGSPAMASYKVYVVGHPEIALGGNTKLNGSLTRVSTESNLQINWSALSADRYSCRIIALKTAPDENSAASSDIIETILDVTGDPSTSDTYFKKTLSSSELKMFAARGARYLKIWVRGTNSNDTAHGPSAWVGVELTGSGIVKIDPVVSISLNKSTVSNKGNDSFRITINYAYTDALYVKLVKDRDPQQSYLITDEYCGETRWSDSGRCRPYTAEDVNGSSSMYSSATQAFTPVALKVSNTVPAGKYQIMVSAQNGTGGKTTVYADIEISEETFNPNERIFVYNQYEKAPESDYKQLPAYSIYFDSNGNKIKANTYNYKPGYWDVWLYKNKGIEISCTFDNDSNRYTDTPFIPGRGCKLLTYAHAIQWFDGKADTLNRQGDILYELLNENNNPSGASENTYNNYIHSEYGINYSWISGSGWETARPILEKGHIITAGTVDLRTTRQDGSHPEGDHVVLVVGSTIDEEGVGYVLVVDSSVKSVYSRSLGELYEYDGTSIPGPKYPSNPGSKCDVYWLKMSDLRRLVLYCELYK